MRSLPAVPSCVGIASEKHSCSEFSARRTCMARADTLLEPDDVTFSVLVRGYGESEPPQWLAISGLLSLMSRKYDVKPSTGKSCSSSHCGLAGWSWIVHGMRRKGVVMLLCSNLQCAAGDLR